MNIREYAKLHDHKVVGKLKRAPELEISKRYRTYVDEAGNIYDKDIKRGNISISTPDDKVF